MVYSPSLRDGSDVMQLVAYLCDSLSDDVPFFMQNTNPHGAPAAALNLPPDSGHEHGAAAYGFAVVLFIVEAQIKIPPVVKQGNEVGHEPAGRELARCEAVPASLVLEFVKRVFGVGAIAVVPGHGLGGKRLLI